MPVNIKNILLDEGSFREVVKTALETPPLLILGPAPSLADAVSAIKEGPAGVLTKPIDCKRLKLVLERRLGESDASSGESSSPNPTNSGPRPPESNLTIKPSSPLHNGRRDAGLDSLKGGRQMLPGKACRRIIPSVCLA
jgi:hypothetical protein